jgi:hypothetical protein
MMRFTSGMDREEGGAAMPDSGTSAGRTRSVPEEEPLAAEGSLGPNVLRAGGASAPASPGDGASTSTSARPDRARPGDHSAPGRLLQEQRTWLRTILVRIRDQSLRHLRADQRDVDREEPLPGDSARGSELPHRLLDRLRRGVPLVMWTDRRLRAPIRSDAPDLWCRRAWSPARVARELAIPKAAVVSWIKALPVPLRDSPDPGDPP